MKIWHLLSFHLFLRDHFLRSSQHIQPLSFFSGTLQIKAHRNSWESGGQVTASHLSQFNTHCKQALAFPQRQRHILGADTECGWRHLGYGHW